MACHECAMSRAWHVEPSPGAKRVDAYYAAKQERCEHDFTNGDFLPVGTILGDGTVVEPFDPETAEEQE